MFERFTERARQVVVLAQDEARALRHDAIDAEHLLLGILREEDGVGARVLVALGVTAEDVRARVVRLVGQGAELATGQIPFSPAAKHALELALREGMALGQNFIATEHLLLGLARENTGVAARILRELDVDAETIRHEVIAVLAAPDSGYVAPAGVVVSVGGERGGRRPRKARGGDDGLPPPRFTRASRRSLILAQDEARALGHARMGTEHILLGLLVEGGLTSRMLEALEIPVDDVRAEVVRIAGQGGTAQAGHIPFTPQAKAALDRARSEAVSLDQDAVSTEHILLSLLIQDDGIAARILRGYRR